MTQNNKKLTTSGLSLIEKISILLFAAIFISGGIGTIIYLSQTVKTDSSDLKPVELPIKGQRLEITSLSTYWQKPITEGESIDTVAHGTKLVPVISLKISGNGVIRILFKDGEGNFIGDTQNSSVNSAEKLRIAATSGFRDFGMHTAYQTGHDPRWTIEAYEGPSADAPKSKFNLLFTTEISSNLR